MYRSCTGIQTLSYYLVRLICESTEREKLQKIPFQLVYLFYAPGLHGLRNVVSDYFPSVHVLRLHFQVKIRTTRFAKSVGLNQDDQLRCFSSLFLTQCLPCDRAVFVVRSAHNVSTAKNNKNNKSASASSADAGWRALPVAIAGLQNVKVFSLPVDILCCENRQLERERERE